MRESSPQQEWIIPAVERAQGRWRSTAAQADRAGRVGAGAGRRTSPGRRPTWAIVQPALAVTPDLSVFAPEHWLAVLLFAGAGLLVVAWWLLRRDRPAWAGGTILLVPPALLVGFALLVWGGPEDRGSVPPTIAADAASFANGQALFAQHCTVCHGPQGRGDGPNAPGFDPRPTDFVHPAAAERSDAALLAAITQGVSGSGMPPWGEVLDERARRDLVVYLRGLNPLTGGRALVPAPSVVARATADTDPAPTLAAGSTPSAPVAAPIPIAPPTPLPAVTATIGPAGTSAVAPTAAAPPTPSTPTPTPSFDPARVRVTTERVGAGFDSPLYITHAGDGSGRLFILEKIGRVRTLDNATFLDIRDRVTSPPLFSYEREQGLLGLAFHPRFGENGYLYVHYNDRNGDHVVSRFTAGPGSPADPASEAILLTQDQPQTNFNGGQLAFGPDGFLYIGLGTGGTARDLQENAQAPGSLLGKILRLDVDGGEPYGIPPGNPFVGQPGARPEIWAYGLRNPWRFSFDRGTGDLYVASPGEFRREWVQYHPAEGPAGQNFGWPILEGTLCWREPACAGGSFPPPIVEYPTYEGGNCAVIGGYVYRGQRSPRLAGAYLFGDFCGGRVYAAARDAGGGWTQAELAQIGGLIGSFGEDEAGEIYVADIQNGIIYRLLGAAR